MSVSMNLIKRIIVAAIAIPVILWLIYESGYYLFGLVSLLTIIAFFEFMAAEKVGPSRLLFWIALWAVVSLILFRSELPWLAGCPLDHQGISIIVIFFLIGGMLQSIGHDSPPDLFTHHARVLWGVTYIGLLYPFVFLLGARVDISAFQFARGDLLLFLFGLLWVGDTAAMGFGSWLGKKKLAPAVSPNKTVAGLVGGFIGAVVIGLIMYFWKLESLGLAHVLILAVGCSLFGQLGDLVESMWKRSLGIKDSSAIIPGHGGVLDRFDSLLFAAPFMYYYLIFVVLK